MARQYLAEGLKGAFPFIADAQKIVVESLPGGKTRTRIPGRFSVCDCVNGNGRRYGKPVWEKNLSPGSTLMTAINKNAAFGLLEHPKDGQVTLQSPISHLVVEAKLQPGHDTSGKQIWEVTGEIMVLGTDEGKKLTALIEAGYNPLVSSRGFGSLVRGNDGIDEVQDDYVCEGWDVVIKPSFETAELNPPREQSTTEAASPQAASPSPGSIAESDDNGVAELVETENRTRNKWAHRLHKKKFAELNKEQQDDVDHQIGSLKLKAWHDSPSQQEPSQQESAPAGQNNLEADKGKQAPAPVASTPVKQHESSQVTAMNLNEIKAAITGFRGTDASKLQPQRFAEGMSQLSALHQEVANFVAEDAKRSWQGNQLQDDITQIEQSWTESQLAPGKRAGKLTEDNTKLMQVIKAVATTGLTFKNKLGESIKQSGRQAALLNEVVERGQAWRQLARTNEADSAKYRRRFMMASEALQQLASKYKSDVTELGKRVIQLEFKEKAETPEIQKMLKEATKPKQLVEIRAVLEGKNTLPAKGKSAPSLTEGKKPAAPTAKGNPPAPVSEGVTILSDKPNDPRGLDEAIGMVTRLSKSITA